MAETETQQRLSLKQQRDAMRDGRLLGWECPKCHARSYTPVTRCVNGHADLQVREFAKEGKVVTYTIQVIAPEAFLNEVPFAWVIVELDEGGPRVSGWVPFVAKPDELKIGQRVRFTPTYKPGLMFEKVN